MPPLTEPPPPLNEKRWAEFLIEKIFDISPGKRLTKAEMIAGDVPFIGASDSNNGVTNFVGNENDSADKNVLGVNYNGSVCECFYHPYRCIFSDDVKRFHLKNRAGNNCVYLFLANSIRQQKNKFNYGYKFNETRMRRQKIFLPVDESGAPDYDYMENYIRAIEEKLLQRYREYCRNCRPPLTIQSLNEKIWRPFFISDVADILSGRDIYEDEREEGNNPYIGASSRNNGICHFVSNENETLESNCISVNRNGSVGYAFFHSYAALYSNDCRKLRPHIRNEFVSLFIAHQITAQRGKYNYGYKMGTERLKRQKIHLPINDAGEPDFEYMENYIKNIEAEKYRRYLNYLDAQ